MKVFSQRDHTAGGEPQSEEVLRQIVERLQRRLEHPRYDELCRTLVLWMRRLVIPRVVREEPLPEFDNLQDLHDLLSQRPVLAQNPQS